VKWPNVPNRKTPFSRTFGISNPVASDEARFRVGGSFSESRNSADGFSLNERREDVALGELL